MAKSLFEQLDLNALKVFFILYQEKNMRRASRRLFVTQPSLSKKLQKLRNHFSDQLFVKVSTGLEPTAYANTLYQQTHLLFSQLQLAVDNSVEFNPATITETINLAVSPFLSSALGEGFFKRLKKQAPQCNLQVYNWSSKTKENIEHDQIDVGITYQLSETNKQLKEQFIIADSFHCLVRQGHPYKKGLISMLQASKYPFATIISRDWNTHLSLTETAFSKQGIAVDITYRSEFPAAILDVVENSDILFPHSRFYPLTHGKQFRIINIDNSETYMKPNVCAYFHQKNSNNPRTTWLLKLIEDTLKQVLSDNQKESSI